jgi:tetraacyldisaccharide 4'-kinase
MKGLRHIKRPLLLPLSCLYWIIVSVRNLLFDLQILRSKSFCFPIISVGNITVGGTGKTPHVELLIRMLTHDFQLAVLSRGYKRKSKGFNLATRHSLVSDVGDEPLQIKTKFPEIQVAVDNHRVHGVKKLLKIRHKPEVILLDDAFQHRYIHPGLSILLVDYNRPVFDDCLLPAGNLREPWKNNKRADIIVVTKCPSSLLAFDRARFSEKLRLHLKQHLYFTSYAYGSPQPVFAHKKKKNEVITFKQLRKAHASVLLVTGIADPRPVLQFLQQNVHIKDSLFFPDHYEFKPQDLQRILNHFQSLPGTEKYIVVTEKDAVRLQELEPDEVLKKALLYVPVEVKFLAKGEKPFFKHIEKYIRKASKSEWLVK